MQGPEPDPQHDAAWRRRLTGLDGSETLDRNEEQRTVGALRSQDLLRRSARMSPAFRAVAGAAASVALLLIGAWWGKNSAPAVPMDPRPRFALFLVEDSSFQGTRTVGHDALVEEYTAWAGTLARSGHLVLGEELEDRETRLGRVAQGKPGSLEMMTGLFILTAGDLDEAIRLARTSPHLRHGGGILVRPIVLTSPMPPTP